MNKISILVVCTANVCRSPMAEAILKHYLKQRGVEHRFVIESAGTHVARKGLSHDPRVDKVLEKYNIETDCSGTRVLQSGDFEKYNYILVMDQRNFESVTELCPPEYRDKISYVMSYSENPSEIEVPDPYFGNIAGFERVYSMLDKSMKNFVNRL
ncbi:MAG: low molecular weight protein-tyrosine-phosphatase [Sedimenticola sp.]